MLVFVLLKHRELLVPCSQVYGLWVHSLSLLLLFNPKEKSGPMPIYILSSTALIWRRK